MAKDQTEQSYEVYCNQCRVTFPVEMKTCLHCGGRLHRERYSPSFELPPALEEIPLDEEEVDVRRSGRFSPLTLVWVLLLLAGYLYRSC